MVRNPGAGTWTVSAAPGLERDHPGQGRPAATRRPRCTPRSGGGATRRLTYSVTTRPGLSIAFAERAHRVYQVLGKAKGAHGTLRFTPGRGHRRQAHHLAIVSENGCPARPCRSAATARRARQPGAGPRPAVRRHGRQVQRLLRRARGRLLPAGGRRQRRAHLLRLIRGRRHSLALPLSATRTTSRVTRDRRLGARTARALGRAAAPSGGSVSAGRWCAGTRTTQSAATMNGDDRPGPADHAGDGQHQDDDADPAGGAAGDDHPVGALLARSSGGLAAASYRLLTVAKRSAPAPPGSSR